MEEAVEILNERAGNILLTTGSKDLAAYMSGVAGARERIYARILPAAESLLMAHELDVPLAHIVAMQGPFSADLNCALIREYDIRILVTKASGARGGFWEKVKAARECGIELLVIERPRAEEGLGFEQVRSLLVQRVSRSMQGGN